MSSAGTGWETYVDCRVRNQRKVRWERQNAEQEGQAVARLQQPEAVCHANVCLSIFILIEKERDLSSTDHSPNYPNILSWVRLKPGGRNLTQVSHAGARLRVAPQPPSGWG